MKRFLVICIYALMLPLGIIAQEVPAWFANPEKGEYVGVSVPMDNEAVSEKSAIFTAIMSYILSVRKEEIKQDQDKSDTQHVGGRIGYSSFDNNFYEDKVSTDRDYKLFSTGKNSKPSIGFIKTSIRSINHVSEEELKGQYKTSANSIIDGIMDISIEEAFIITKREKDERGNVWIAIKPNQVKGKRIRYKGRCRYIHDINFITMGESENYDTKSFYMEMYEINNNDSSVILYTLNNEDGFMYMNSGGYEGSTKCVGNYEDKIKKVNYDRRFIQAFLSNELQTIGYNTSGLCGISQFFNSKTASYTASMLNMISAFIEEEDKSTYLNGLNNVGNFFSNGFSQCYYMPSIVDDKPKYAVTVEEREEISNTFVVAIGNENYQQVEDVPYAHNDVNAFAEYCQRTLNIPEKQILVYENATYGTIHMAMKRLKDVSNAYQGDMKIIFYYAGHGIPDEKSSNSYLLPTDADGTMPEVCYSLNQLYNDLGSMNAKQVVVFMDACFSGSKRDGGMLQSARGVAIKAKEGALRGNMIVFSAASGEQTAYPYKPKEHGLFTYYLLSKLQKDNGNMTLGELADYIKSEVSRTSIVENKKAQTPNISISPSLSNNWKNMKLK